MSDDRYRGIRHLIFLETLSCKNHKLHVITTLRRLVFMGCVLIVYKNESKVDSHIAQIFTMNLIELGGGGPLCTEPPVLTADLQCSF